MLSAQEWVDLIQRSDTPTQKKFCQQGIWVSGLDLLQHILKGDPSNTFFRGDLCAPLQLEELDDDIQKHSKGMEDDFKEIEATSYFKLPQWEKYMAEIGDEIILDRYLDRIPLCFSDRRKKPNDKPAISIIFDTGIPWSERRGTIVQQRHEYIYQVAFEAESEGRPCRVIGVNRTMIPEVDYIASFVIIKDYLDPIFPGLWGAFVSNRSTNSFINCFFDYFVGTRHWGNGTPTNVYVDDYIFDEQLTIPHPDRCDLHGPNMWRNTEGKPKKLPDIVN